MRHVRRFFVFVIGVVLIGALTLVGAKALLPSVWDSLPFGTKEVDRSQPALLTAIEDISQFHAAVGNFEVLVDLEQDTKWVPGFLSGERSLFVAAGTVDAYVDFSGLGEGDLTVDHEAKTVEIRLPDPQLTEPNLDQDRTYLYSQDRGLVNAIGDALSTDDQQDLYLAAEEKMSTAAESSVLRAQADTNTRSMLSGMLQGLGYTAVFVD